MGIPNMFGPCHRAAASILTIGLTERSDPLHCVLMT